MPSFTDLGARADLADRLAARGIGEPFPVQAATIPDALAGRDVSGKAPTGSGKTIAFGIPLVSRVRRARSRRPRALVLLPTRELAAQVHRELELLAGPNGPRVAAFYGGVGFGGQLDALRKGVEIAVACPGRLADLVQRGAARLDEIEVVVLDEADRMADMGFLPQVRALLDQTPAERQTLLFSATLDGDVDVLVQRYQRDPVRHEVAASDDGGVSRQLFWRVEPTERAGLAAKVVGREWPAVVFTRTKHGADRLATQLQRHGVTAAPLHSGRTQGQRERALAAFANGKVQALVATDIAARGIHVDDVACVVHFDPPADEKDYIHRSGRTGRAGATGVVVSFVPPQAVDKSRTMQRKLGLDTAVHNPVLDSLQDDRFLARPAVAPAAPRPQSGAQGAKPGAKQGQRRRRPQDQSQRQHRRRTGRDDERRATA